MREGCSLGLSKQSPEIINQMGTKQEGRARWSGLTGWEIHKDPFSCPKTALICYQKQVGAEDTWICNQPDMQYQPGLAVKFFLSPVHL